MSIISNPENISFETTLIQEVNNLKGFGIFFNIQKFNKDFFDENLKNINFLNIESI